MASQKTWTKGCRQDTEASRYGFRTETRRGLLEGKSGDHAVLCPIQITATVRQS
jgi:hypothetical protein